MKFIFQIVAIALVCNAFASCSNQNETGSKPTKQEKEEKSSKQ